MWQQFAEYYEKEKLSLSSAPQLTHIDADTNEPCQVDVGEKQATSRTACASGYIQLNAVAFAALTSNSLKKGNALQVAQLAGIQASKQTASLIPLCHQVLLDVCQVVFEVDVDQHRVLCRVTCKTTLGKTGVEMEAMTACAVALLTVYDMCKAVQKDAVIHGIRLEYKYGGKSDFKRG